MLAVFAQYGEVVDVHLVRDKSTGKSRGFCFLAYEDQRSTVLAVDNLSGAKVAGRIIRVEHVDNYKKKKAEVCASVCMEGEDPNKVSDDDQPPPQLELLEPAGAQNPMTTLLKRAVSQSRKSQQIWKLLNCIPPQPSASVKIANQESRACRAVFAAAWTPASLDALWH
eukprot:1133646-Pelagomonas_calceolata.AAC.10